MRAVMSPRRGFSAVLEGRVERQGEPTINLPLAAARLHEVVKKEQKA